MEGDRVHSYQKGAFCKWGVVNGKECVVLGGRRNVL